MEMMDGTLPPKDLPYVVNGRTRTMPFYVTDKAYHKYPVFLCRYAKPNTRKQRIFNRLQEAMRKDVERLNGVLTARFHMLLRPSRFTSVAQMIKAVKAMEILHKMVVLERRGEFLGNRRIAAAAAARGDHGASDGGAAGEEVGGEVAAPSSAGAAATGGDDQAGLGSVYGRLGVRCGMVGGEVEAPSSSGTAAAGGHDPSGLGRGYCSLDHTRLDPLPGGNMPVVRTGVDPPSGSFLFFLEARAAITDHGEFLSLRDDRAEHGFANRGAYLAPYL